MDVDQLESLIEWIYTSALVPVLWTRTVDRITALTSGRGSSSATDDDLKPYLESLQRHLQKAQTIHDTLSEQFERRGIGQLSLDEHGQVTFCDDVAQNCLKRGGLVLDSGMLKTEAPTQQAQLNDVVSQLLSEDAEPVILAFNRSKYSTPLVARFVRIGSEVLDDRFRPAKGVMVRLRDPEDFGHVDALRLRQLFGLTARESALALATVRGESLSAYALTNGVTRETARSHLKSLCRKVGVRGQRQLVSILLNALR